MSPSDRSPRTEATPPEWVASTLSGGRLEPPRIVIAPGALLAERFEIGDVLGAGGFAVVYRAHDRALGCEVALKVLRSDRLTPPVLTRFRREAQVARALAHPRLLRIFDFGTTPEAVFLSMELIPGGSLADLLRSGPLTVQDAVRFATEMFEALAALHEAGVIHRDLKPSNLLLDADGHLKVADFGLVRWAQSDATETATLQRILGTIAYIAPEQALGQEADARSDLYSAGVVLFEMPAGDPPHHAGRSDLATLMAQLKKRAPSVRARRSETPRWLGAIVSRLLERRPEDRPADARSVLRDLQRRRPARWLSVQARRWVATAGLALIGACGAVFFEKDKPLAADLHIAPLGAEGIEARNGRGERVWSMPDVSADVRLVPARLTAGAAPVLVGVVYPPDGALPAETRVLSIVDPANGQILRQIQMPDRPDMFDELPDRYHVRESLTAVDLDGDGLDEIVATFNHAESAPSYTVVYEPVRDRVRTVFYGWGNQDIAGVADLDGDGRPELLIAGINNGFGWYNELAAVRIDPPIGADGVMSAAVSPESAVYPEQRKDLLWYTLLPPGRFIDLKDRVRADPARRRLDVYFEGQAPVGLGFDGFRLDAPTSTPTPERAAARDKAYRASYEARRLATAGFAPAALRQSEDSVRQAALAEDSILAECIARQRARLLVGLGREREGLGLFDVLSRTSPNASDISFDAARALHLRGDLEPAELWYARGLGPGGRIDVGKSKWEFAEGALLALGEQHRWAEARRWLDRFLGSYPEFRQWVSIYREYIKWRSGETVRLQEVAVSPRTTVQMRYWLMEYRARAGEAADSLLADVEKELEQPSEMQGELRSLEGVLLAQLGRRQESEVAERLAFEEVRQRLGTSVLARAHVDLVAERFERAMGPQGAASTRELVATVLRQLEPRVGASGL